MNPELIQNIVAVILIFLFLSLFLSVTFEVKMTDSQGVTRDMTLMGGGDNNHIQFTTTS